ncbi:coiled-coil and C2 domain-containing protein 1-like isoform X2 [Zerene cesonia]|uniref:coiled-coil and C2 domain-containing protein 1-like isoform X2 n=1 Tax=Zerene cesonia TaxID=33412 RepID=UPI0018E567DD|nr:coiled-coil and C2 domain-containing protein 1-like isoform X2 [Zerene cesonia]
MSRKPNSGKRGNLSQFGLIDIPDFDDEPMDLSDDDGDLEAELAAITGGGGKRSRPTKPATVAPADLDAMIAASLRDVPSDDEGSGDDDDPDLLNELQELAFDDEAPRLSRPAPPPPGTVSAENSTVSLLQERISNYTIAEKAAKESGEGSRARRFGRGLKTLNDLLKQAKAGRPINEEDIPPPVSVGKPAAPAASEAAPTTPSAPQPEPVPQPPARRAPAPPPRTESLREERPATPPEPKEPPPPLPTEAAVDPAKEEGLRFILKRKEEFKAAALSSKHAGDKAMALEYLKVVKQFDIVVDAYKAGEAMDLNELPTPEAIAAAVRSQTSEEQVQNSAEPTPAPASEGTLITASSVDEALKQRLAAFQEQEAKAKEQGNASKARRMGRIVKQYQEAIRLHAAGKPLPLDELPTPNGFAPIPGEQSPKPTASPAGPRSPAGPTSPAVPTPSPRPSPQLTRNDKQLLLLMHRQKEFKEAAINAKKSGNMEQAKEYLRAAKGFDSLIEATKGGLPVDLKSIPLPPKAKKQIEETFDIVSAEDCDPQEDSLITSDGDDVMSRLHAQLTRQLKLCVANRDHYRAMGNIAESNRFEHMAVSVKQDLDVVAVAKSLNQPPPKFHYEGRQFAIVQCNSDLNENDLELTIVRGIAYTVPNPREVDTYVKFEFPYPQDAPVCERTALVKDTNSPQYGATYTLPIQRQARACARAFKRHAIKFEVYSRGGWFSRDTLVGAVAVKLAPLETQVTLHEAYPLMDGRRPAGGSLEVRLRVRTPLLQQQIEHTKHRWLVIDN